MRTTLPARPRKPHRRAHRLRALRRLPRSRRARHPHCVRPAGHPRTARHRASPQPPRYAPQTFAPVGAASMFKAPVSTPRGLEESCSRVAAPDAPSDVDADAETLPWHLDIDPPQLRWESYVKAGYYYHLTTFATAVTLVVHSYILDPHCPGNYTIGKSGIFSCILRRLKYFYAVVVVPWRCRQGTSVNATCGTFRRFL